VVGQTILHYRILEWLGIGDASVIDESNVRRPTGKRPSFLGGESHTVLSIKEGFREERRVNLRIAYCPRGGRPG
jgi:hypothetical protein